MIKYKKLCSILTCQSKTFKQNHFFQNLCSYFTKFPALQNAKISLQAFRKLNKAQLSQTYIRQFYLKNKIPYNNFFSAFQQAKKQYLQENIKKKNEKISKTTDILSKLSLDKKHILKYFLAEEKLINKKITLWRKYFYNISQKKAKMLVNADNLDFYLILHKYILDFQAKYKKETTKYLKTIIYFALEFDKNISNELAKKQYKNLCKKYHPDTGGTNQKFILLTEIYNQYLSFNDEVGFFSK